MDLSNVLNQLSISISNKNLSEENLDFIRNILNSNVHNNHVSKINLTPELKLLRGKSQNQKLFDKMALLLSTISNFNEELNDENYGFKSQITTHFNLLQKLNNYPVGNPFETVFDNYDNQLDVKNNLPQFMVHINETILINDLCYILLDVDGNFLHITNKPFNWEIKCSETPKNTCPPFILNNFGKNEISKRMHPATWIQICRIGQCGWLYYKIQNFLNDVQNVGEKGLIYNVFKKCVNDELSFYHEFVTVIRECIESDFAKYKEQRQQHSKDDDMKKDNVKENSFILNPLLSVQRLLAITLPIQHKLEVLLSLVLACQDLKGTEILNVIYDLIQRTVHEDWKVMLKNIYKACIYPFLTFILNWMQYGRLNDSYREFPIEEIDDSKSTLGDEKSLPTDVRQEWKGRFNYHTKMTPIFMHRSDLYKIYSGGKCSHFLLNDCNVSRSSLKTFTDILSTNKINNIQNENNLTTDDRDTLIDMAIEFGDSIDNPKFSDAFRQAIDTMYMHHTTLLMDHLVLKLGLLEHFEALKGHLLLARGDFTSQLLTAFYALDKDAVKEIPDENTIPSTLPEERIKVLNSYRINLRNKFFIPKLTESVEEAIYNSNSIHVFPQVKDRLKVSVDERQYYQAVTNKSQIPMWELFSLKYMIDGPLSMIITPVQLSHYQSLFLVIWRTKWLGFKLCKAWKNQRNYPNFVFSRTKLTKDKVSQNNSPMINIDSEIILRIHILYRKHIGVLLHAFHTIVTSMLHFIQQIQYYLHFEVMECSWTDFMQSLNLSNNNEQCKPTDKNTPNLDLNIQSECIDSHEENCTDLQDKNCSDSNDKKNATSIINSGHDFDSLVACHEKYLWKLRQGFLLTAKDKTLYAHLLSLYDLVLRFLNLQFQMHTTLFGHRLSYDGKLNEDHICDIVDQDLQNLIDNRHHFNPVEEKIIVPKSTFLHKLITFQEKCHLLKASYDSLMKDFLFMLTDRPLPLANLNTKLSHSGFENNITPHSDFGDFNAETINNMDALDSRIHGLDKPPLYGNKTVYSNVHLYQLNFRLDFNHYYRNADLRLRSSLTWGTRMSQIQNLVN